jgi:nicotinamidase/pyrazinamidase
MQNRPSLLQKGDALLIIDVQQDFCPGGALAIEGADQIIPSLNQWIQQAQRMGVAVYASRDWHPEGHISFKQQGGGWPRHCIQDTGGAEFHPDLRLPDAVDDLEIDACQKAPEWAEHARFDDSDQPCDDGRSGKI